MATQVNHVASKHWQPRLCHIAFNIGHLGYATWHINIGHLGYVAWHLNIGHLGYVMWHLNIGH